MMEINEVATIPQLKTEIKFYEKQTAVGMLEIGKRLIQIKEQLPHGEFIPWIERELNYSRSSANNFIRCYEEYGNVQSIGHLNPTQGGRDETRGKQWWIYQAKAVRNGYHA